MGQIAGKQLIGGAPHELGGEAEDGEHGTGATRVALIVELQSAGERFRKIGVRVGFLRCDKVTLTPFTFRDSLPVKS